MNKQKIIEFFDQCAPWWDDDMIRNEDIIQTILDHAHIKNHIDVLDVACGTGVLFQDYINRNVNITGIDISQEMTKIAKNKYPDIHIICGDVETATFNQLYDVVMIYNAFPHFADPKHLIRVLTKHIKDNGRLSIAHGMSRENLLKHHQRAKDVSIDLLEIDELEKLLEPYYIIETKISNDQMYQIVGRKK